MSLLYLIIGLFAGFLIGSLFQSYRATSKSRHLEIENAELKKDHEADAERLQWLETAEGKLKDAFEALSSNILTANADQFLKQSREKVGDLLELQKKDWGTQKEEFKNLVQPLEKSLGELDKQVQELELRREGAYEGLNKHLDMLSISQKDLISTTNNLNQALRATDVRGKWGNVQLRRIAEMVGMLKHIDFSEEVVGEKESPDGEKGRVDMTVNLPNKGIIPVDAKTPMIAYLASLETKDEKERQAKLDEHAKAIRGHMMDLAAKSYWEQFDLSPEFVVMVVPYDSGLTVAFEKDSLLFQDALDKKVFIVSPVSLLALLKVISYGWMQIRLADSAQQIAEQGKELYKRFSTFAGHLSEVGKRLNSLVKSYNKAVGSLESRVTPSVSRLKEMGAGSEELPENHPVDIQARSVSDRLFSEEE